MSQLSRVLLCLSLLLTVLHGSSLAGQTPASPMVGHWQGTLIDGKNHLRLVLEITAQPAGYAARLFSIDQGPDPMPATTVTVTGQHLRVVLSAINGTFDGDLQPGNTVLKGTWTQGPPLPLELVRATDATRWQSDNSPHHASLVEVAPGVKLEVLDWGGTGRTLVLLAGLGNTAHIFDQFAPKLTPHFHVVGITRRGFGESSVPDPATLANYTADRLGDDVLAVLAALHLERPILVGHSIAGEELSSVASSHPASVAGLVYLDAGFPYALYDPSRGDFLLDLLDLRRKLDLLLPGSGVPSPTPILRDVQADLPLFEKDLTRQEQEDAVMPHPPATAPTTPAPPSPGLAIQLGQRKFLTVTPPTLAIFAVPHDLAGLFPDHSKELAEAEEIDSKRMVAVADGFAQRVPSAKVIRLKGANHFVFKSNEADVLQAVEAFIATLPQ